MHTNSVICPLLFSQAHTFIYTHIFAEIVNGITTEFAIIQLPDPSRACARKLHYIHAIICCIEKGIVVFIDTGKQSAAYLPNSQTLVVAM